ncbi:MAG TPA: hypothetical protein VHM90_15960 [Phycisphaerae bacterium]|nr:hypothetical protein [Phycisphaerae bacterium]
MDGRNLKSLTYIAATCVLLGAGTTFAQAMKQIDLDSPGPAAVITPSKPEVPATAPAASVPSAEMPAKLTVPEAPKAAPPATPPAAAATEPTAVPRMMEDPIKPAGAPPENKTAGSSEKIPAAEAPPKTGDSKVSIESKAIRPSATDAGTSAPAPAKTTTGTGFGGGGIAQVATALAVVVGLILIGKAMAKKFIPGAKGGPAKGVIEILARHPLAKNQSIVLVRIGSQIVALNQGRESSQSVLVINEPTEVAKIIGQIEGRNPDSISAGFNKLLANARMDLEESPEEPELRSTENLDEQLEEMAAAKRQLMELRQHVRSVRDRLPRE